MSYVSNIIISFSVSDEDHVLDIKKFFVETFKDVPPKDLDESTGLAHYGGSKALEKTVMVGAHNYLKIDTLVKFMESLGWFIPEDVQLLVCDENDEPSIFTERLHRENMKPRFHLD